MLVGEHVFVSAVLTSREFGAMYLCLSFDKLCVCGGTRVHLWYLTEFCACVLCSFCARITRFVAHGRSFFFSVDQRLWVRYMHRVLVSGVGLQSRYDKEQHPFIVSCFAGCTLKNNSKFP